MKRNTQILQAITIVLLVMWIPASIDKFINFNTFQQNMHRQPFSSSITITTLIIYSLPILELLTILLLLFSKSRIWGFVLSSLLMSIFTIYIALALLKVWDRIPCACGLIISQMGWVEHFWFNLFFMTVSIIGWNREITLLSKQSLDLRKNSRYN